MSSEFLHVFRGTSRERWKTPAPWRIQTFTTPAQPLLVRTEILTIWTWTYLTDFLQLIAKLEVGPKDSSKKGLMEKILTKTFWVIGTSRNAILVIVCGALGYFFVSENRNMVSLKQNATTDLCFNKTEVLDESPFIVIGFIPPGLPEFKIPPFGYTKNNTYVSFTDIMGTLGSSMIVLPLIALLENIAICKAFCKWFYNFGPIWVDFKC